MSAKNCRARFPGEKREKIVIHRESQRRHIALVDCALLGVSDGLKKRLVNFDTSPALKESTNRGLLAALAYYQLARPAKVPSFVRWVLASESSPLHRILSSPPDLMAIFDRRRLSLRGSARDCTSASEIPTGRRQFTKGECAFYSAQNEATPTMSYYIFCSELPSKLVFGAEGGVNYVIERPGLWVLPSLGHSA